MRQRGSFAGGALVLVVRVTPSGAESAESILPLRLVGVGGCRWQMGGTPKLKA